MVNHLRTLLLNQAAGPGSDYPGEEYVPAGYVPRTLPRQLALAREALFGADPDRAALNWRLHELMACVHGTGMGEYALAADRRVTYLPQGRGLFDLAAAGPSAVKLSAAAQAFEFQGAAAPESDRAYYRWRVDVVSASLARVTGPAGGTADVGYTLAGGLSTTVPLPGAGLGVRFGSGVGGAWAVDLLTPPRRPLAAAVGAVAALPADVEAALFAGAGAYETFRAVWLNHDQLPYRAAALALALGYRTGELPPG